MVNPLSGFVVNSNGGLQGIGFTPDTFFGVPYQRAGPVYIAPPLTTVEVAAATGVNPLDNNYSIWGHNIPLYVFGIGRIGGELISGPWFNGGLAYGGVSFGVPADPSGTRTLVEVAIDSEVVWTGSQVGNGSALSSSGFTVEPFTMRFYSGTLTQTVDPLETTYFGSQANAYRPQTMLFIDGLPLAHTKFGRFPYVSCKFSDSSGNDVNLGEALERLAYGPWVGLTSSDFETSGITDGLPDGGLVITQDTEFLQLIQQLGRFYPQWDILQTDKLRVVDRGDNVSPDIQLDTTRLMGEVKTVVQGEDSVRKDLELSTIDPGSDYTIVNSVAGFPRDPAIVSTSVGKDAAYLPIIMDAFTRQAIVTYAKYHEETRRKRISYTTTAYGFEAEPGDLHAITDLGNGWNNEVFKVAETLHGANYSVECVADAILRCDIGVDLLDPYISYVVLLLSGHGADASTTFTDESPKLHGNATSVGTSVVDTAQSKFGGSSILFDGSGSTLHFGSSTDWEFGNGNFTVEGWIRPATVAAGTRFIVGRWGDLIFPLLSWVFYQDGAALAFNVSTTGSNNIVVASGGTLVANTWQHVAVDFDGVKTRLYINGTMVASDSTIRTIVAGNPVVPLAVGGYSSSTALVFNGWIDELRISKGVARYATDTSFTVPVSAFPRF